LSKKQKTLIKQHISRDLGLKIGHLKIKKVSYYQSLINFIEQARCKNYE